MNPCLIILNPRRIPACIEAFESLDVPKAWLTCYSEKELESVFPDVVDRDFTHFIAVSDDVVVTDEALRRVMALLRKHPVATGYCSLDETSELVNLTRGPLREPKPSVSMYDFYRRDEIEGLVESFFTGMCLTGMTKELWQRFPFLSYGPGRGCCSDYMLSWRLQEANIPIVSHEHAYVEHLKTTWNETDPRPERQLTYETSEVRWT